MRKLNMGLWIVIIAISIKVTVFADERLQQNQLNDAIIGTGNYLMESIENPTVSSVGGEWIIIGLSRSNIDVPNAYYLKYYNNLIFELNDSKGNLTSTKYTEYSRIILALTAMGKDITNVGEYNLLEKLSNFENVKKQGINSLIYALIALDSNQYEIPLISGIKIQTTRQLLIDSILREEITYNGDVGGFSLKGLYPDPDVTGMALQALSKYKNQENVNSAIERAIKVLDKMDIEKSGSEGLVQVILGKTAIGVDCNTEMNLLMKYYVNGGGFKHTINGNVDLMASEQGLYALIAYERFLNNDNHIYDMTDKYEENEIINADKDIFLPAHDFLLRFLTTLWLIK